MRTLPLVHNADFKINLTAGVGTITVDDGQTFSLRDIAIDVTTFSGTKTLSITDDSTDYYLRFLLSTFAFVVNSDNSRSKPDDIKLAIVNRTGSSVTFTEIINEGIESNIKNHIEDRVPNFSFDGEATFDTVDAPALYDVVYLHSDGDYYKSIGDGVETPAGFKYSILTNTDNLVVTQGYLPMGTNTSTGSGNEGTLGYLATNATTVLDIGDPVYCGLTTPGSLSSDKTKSLLGLYAGQNAAGEYVLLASAGSGSGSGDTNMDDLLYNTLLQETPFYDIYYDAFNDPGSVDSATATYDAATASYEGVEDQILQHQIISEPTNVWSATAVETGDEILEDSWIWEALNDGTSSGTEPEWLNIVPLTNLESHYTMDSITGTTISDDGSGSHNATIVNGYSLIDGYIGKAINLNVSNEQYINCGTSMGTALGVCTDFTVSFKFRAKTTDGNDGLFYIGDFGGTDGGIQITLESNLLTYQLNGAAFSETTSFSDVSTKWHTCTATYKGGTTTGELWLNGEKVISSTTNCPSSINLSGLQTIIGAYYQASGYTLDGDFEGVRIYDTVLSDYQIANLYYHFDNTITVGRKIFDEGGVLWEATRANKLHRCMVHAEILGDPRIYTEISIEDTPSTWSAIDLDETREFTTGFNNLHVRFTWKGTGVLDSFGVLTNYQYFDNTNSYIRLYEVYTQSGDGAVDDVITLPNNGVYTRDGKSLRVYTAAGLKLHAEDHYDEYTKYSIKIKYALTDGDKLIFQENYGVIDESIDNYARLNKQHSLDGSHVLKDIVTGNYRAVSLVDGELTTIPWNPLTLESYETGQQSPEVASILGDIDALESKVDILEQDSITVDAAYTATVDDKVIMCNTGSGSYTVDLYTTTSNAGKRITIKRIGTNTITIDGDGANIDGVGTKTLTTQYDYMILYCDGSNWHIIGMN